MSEPFEAGLQRGRRGRDGRGRHDGPEARREVLARVRRPLGEAAHVPRVPRLAVSDERPHGVPLGRQPELLSGADPVEHLHLARGDRQAGGTGVVGDPLDQLQPWLNTTLQGARSTIHGDLNLENILVGPGELVWLIDFAQTREGHTQFDFAHLSAEITAHILAPKTGSPQAFLKHLRDGDGLLKTVQEMSQRCLFDPAQDQEHRLALAVTCLGALKYTNLTPLGRHCLYLLAASLAAA